MSQYEDRSYVSKDGLSLYYRDYPGRDAGGTPLLCIPGLTRTSRDFADIAARASATRRVLCVDLRGRGRSAYDPDYNNYSVPVETDDVFRLLDHEGLDEVAVLGTSRGGIIAMVMAALHPERLKGIVLNDIGPQISPEGLQRIASYVGQAGAPRSWDEALAILRAQNGTQYPNLSDARWQKFARSFFVERDGVPCFDYDPNIAETLRTPSAAANLWPQYRRMATIPTLILRGEHSDILSAATVARMKAEKPDLETLTVKDRGHVPFLDEPGVEGAILYFLARLDGAEARAAAAAG
jgi:pimeloyl-ACP methyl ester carboxylesterase